MRRMVPGYDIQSRLLIDLIPFDATAPMRVLDLGSGPGTFAKLVLERYSNAEVVAFDLTEEMLDAARDRCGEFGSRLATVVGNYAADDVGSSYDLVLAGLALQHLDDRQRLDVLRRPQRLPARGGGSLRTGPVLDRGRPAAVRSRRRFGSSAAGLLTKCVGLLPTALLFGRAGSSHAIVPLHAPCQRPALVLGHRSQPASRLQPPHEPAP